MMMGPEPMIRMRWRSSRLGMLFRLPHQPREIVEQIVRIVRAGRGFGMVLHTEYRLAAVAETFQRLIVQIDVGDFDLAQVERIRVHGEPVIVRGDLHAPGEFIAHRMVGAAMSELELVGLAAKGEPEQLVAETDAEDGLLTDELADVAHLGDQRLRIAGAVGEKNAVGLSASTSSALVSDGTTVTRQPACTNRRRMLSMKTEKIKTHTRTKRAVRSR